MELLFLWKQMASLFCKDFMFLNLLGFLKDRWQNYLLLACHIIQYLIKETKLVCFILVLILVPSYHVPFYINIFHVINVKFPGIMGEIYLLSFRN